MSPARSSGFAVLVYFFQPPPLKLARVIDFRYQERSTTAKLHFTPASSNPVDRKIGVPRCTHDLRDN
jgi:hypothetical protein